jgi:hypothetical protein
MLDQVPAHHCQAATRRPAIQPQVFVEQEFVSYPMPESQTNPLGNPVRFHTIGKRTIRANPSRESDEIPVSVQRKYHCRSQSQHLADASTGAR